MERERAGDGALLPHLGGRAVVPRGVPAARASGRRGLGDVLCAGVR